MSHLFKKRGQGANKKTPFSLLGRKSPASPERMQMTATRNDFEKARDYLHESNPRFFDALKDMLAKADPKLATIDDLINWRDAAVIDFMLLEMTHESVIQHLLPQLLKQVHGASIYDALNRNRLKNPHFYVNRPLVIQMVLAPFLGFVLVAENTRTQKPKHSTKLALEDFVREGYIDESSHQIINYLKVLMQPYQHQRLGRPCTYTDEDFNDALIDLFNLIKHKAAEKFKEEQIAETCQSGAITLPDITKSFDDFLEFYKDNASQMQHPYIHNLLYFFDRRAILHTHDKSTMSHFIEKMDAYFAKEMSPSSVLKRDKVVPEVLFYQQCYFAALLLMGTHFSDKKLMTQNIRAHVNRLVMCEKQSSLYQLPKGKAKQLDEFRQLYKEFVEQIHHSATLFMAEAMNYQIQQSKVTLLSPRGSSSTTGGAQSESQSNAVVHPNSKTIPEFFRFMRLLMNNLSQAEVDTLCYNPDFCLVLFHSYLLKTTDSDCLPSLEEVDAALVSEGYVRLDLENRQSLAGKCHCFTVNYDAIQVALDADKSIGQDKIFEKVIPASQLQTFMLEFRQKDSVKGSRLCC